MTVTLFLTWGHLVISLSLLSLGIYLYLSRCAFRVSPVGKLETERRLLFYYLEIIFVIFIF